MSLNFYRARSPLEFLAANVGLWAASSSLQSEDCIRRENDGDRRSHQRNRSYP